MRRLFILAAIGSMVGLSGCNGANTDLERAVVGGAVGCAAGEILADGRCVEGGVIGAGVGVLTN